MYSSIMLVSTTDMYIPMGWQSYGIKFPRDFGLLVKQALYFDRHPSRIPHRYTLHLNPETLIPKH